MCFPNNPKTFKSTFVSKTSQAITKVCTCIWSACGRPGASVGRSSTWTSCCTGRTGSRCRPSKRCLAQKRDKLRQLTSRHYCKRFLTKLFWEATQLDALGGLGFEDHQRMRWGKSPKATESEGWVWRSWVWIPKPARIFLVKSTSITTRLLFSFVYPILCGRLSIFASLWVLSCRSHILKK